MLNESKCCRSSGWIAINLMGWHGSLICALYIFVRGSPFSKSWTFFLLFFALFFIRGVIGNRKKTPKIIAKNSIAGFFSIHFFFFQTIKCIINVSISNLKGAPFMLRCMRCIQCVRSHAVNVNKLNVFTSFSILILLFLVPDSWPQHKVNKVRPPSTKYEK